VIRYLSILALAALGGCAAQAERPASSWTNVNSETGRLTAISDLAALAEQFPESALVQLRLLNAALRGGDSALLRATASRLTEMGYALSPAAFEQLAAHLSAEEASTLPARAAANRQELRGSTVFATVPVEHRLVEGVGWDARTNRLFTSSVVGRELVMLGGQGWRRIDGLDAGSLFGLAIDEPRRLLWVASGVVDPTPSPETAYRGLIALSLDDLQVVRRVPAPAADLSPADIAVAPNGTVYASDPTSGAILRALPQADSMEVLVPSGRLRSPQGIALDVERGRLYVADYNYGLALVNLATGALSRLSADLPMMLNGIDGLFLVDGDLVGIQNGTNPRRIVRIRLDRSGTRATGLEVIERAHSEWGEPTLGQIKEGDLIYVADAQWERFGAGGAVNGAEPLRPTAIRIVPLREGGEPPPR
jgi:hypothetical protein